jgi:glycosyltransferase involved in cell wall biosynthesis
MKISAVIPTRNRANSVRRLCESLQKQTCKLAEIIIIDSSDDKIYKNELLLHFSELPIIWIDSEPSVCIQRNRGIQMATSPWIFLCDDDIELTPDYIEKIVDYIKENPNVGALAGRLLQNEHGEWRDQYPVKNFTDLAWRFIFQLSVWGDINSVKAPALLQPILFLVKKWYVKRRNTSSLAGWPLITNWNEKIFRTEFYSLGANVIRREWLLQSPYDEVLDPSGIGDNYGVALGFPGQEPIHVLISVSAYHHRAQENRLKERTVYYRRILALHYFNKLKKKSALTSMWLIWSFIGNLLIHMFKGNLSMMMPAMKAIILILMGKNPYWIGHVKNLKGVKPVS